jgi:hypothetical protein
MSDVPVPELPCVLALLSFLYQSFGFVCRALSHPNIVQAYTCMTDVPVHELLLNSFRTAHMSVLSSSAYKYLTSMEDRACHLEVGLGI